MELKLYQTFSEELKEEWNALLAESITHVPFLRYEYLSAWWQTFGGGEWPNTARLAIVTARQDNRLVGIAPLFTAEWEGLPSLLLLGSIEISDYLDLIVRPQDLAAFTGELLPFLAGQSAGLLPWNRLDLYNVFETSPTLAALKQAAQQQRWEYTDEPFRPSLTISLPGDWETYLAGIDKKQRHEIRRKMRRAQSGELSTRWYIARDPGKIDAEIEDFLHLMELDPEKARFLTPPMRENFRRTIRCAFDEDCLLLAFLEVDGNKAAAYLSFDYLNQLWVYNSGMDFNYTEYSPGWVLLGELLKWANENGKHSFDFMRGDEDYKFRFGAHQRNVMRVTITRPPL
jgi:CelD/BcsL family acetyltransferase involved in cellulose biosynthesis